MGARLIMQKYFFREFLIFCIPNLKDQISNKSLTYITKIILFFANILRFAKLITNLLKV